MSEEKEFVPTWKYHASEKPKLVKSAEHLAKLGSGWEDAPKKEWKNEHNPKDTTVVVVGEDGEVLSEETTEQSHDEVYAALLAAGYSKKDLRGLSHEELLALPKEK